MWFTVTEKRVTLYIKRFAVTSIIRDREYDVTQGTPDSRIMYFTANPNGEAEVIKVTLKPNPRVRRIIFEEDFSAIGIKGRRARGNILTKLPVHKIALKQRGGSTLGGRKFGSTVTYFALTMTDEVNTQENSRATTVSWWCMITESSTSPTSISATTMKPIFVY